MSSCLRFPAVPPAVGDARRAARELAGRHAAGSDVIDAVGLCVDEAVANVVVHAYRDHGEDGVVELEVGKPDGFLCIYVRDSGRGMEPRPDSPGAGFGLSIIAQLTSQYAIRPGADGGTELAMRFDLTA